MYAYKISYKYTNNSIRCYKNYIIIIIFSAQGISDNEGEEKL